ncbi:MAG: Na/Pi symporter [Sporolactobacillus sp.]|nr:Na/Pi symporter [Sporolactobacillus sp.]
MIALDHRLVVFLLYILLFLLGMGVMTGGMHHLVGSRMRSALERAAATPLRGLAIGTLSSLLLQSSSAVTIVIVGLIATGAMRFRQSVGIILGANIGTTVTGEIASLHIDAMHWYFFAAGILCMCLPRRRSFAIGSLLFGIGCLFAAMAGFSSLARPLAASPTIRDLLADANGSLFYAVFAGTVFAAIIQSSSATMLVCMGFLDHHILTLPAATAIMLGSNVGTCLTTYIASLGAGKEGRWAAYTHILFNVLGVLLFFPLIEPATNLFTTFAGDGRAALAHLSVIFNLITALCAVPLAAPFGRWVERNHL